MDKCWVSIFTLKLYLDSHSMNILNSISAGFKIETENDIRKAHSFWQANLPGYGVHCSIETLLLNPECHRLLSPCGGVTLVEQRVILLWEPSLIMMIVCCDCDVRITNSVIP
ncbi:hypothetical protein HS088_TW03G00845 [Tripterygium wilfordii]|uniref:Uncharacterized protein n=1 Tax=Tripterygium wilfordii TaxID=458696 RepID=A0A7J7DVW2_TRIWF|nr:hypothetical protein HS088_TW03G00845 [Tripterygium wilfordii]